MQRQHVAVLVNDTDAVGQALPDEHRGVIGIVYRGARNEGPVAAATDLGLRDVYSDEDEAPLEPRPDESLPRAVHGPDQQVRARMVLTADTLRARRNIFRNKAGEDVLHNPR